MNQLPQGRAERRRQLVPVYKLAKQKNQKVKSIGEKLLLEGKRKNVKRDGVKENITKLAPPSTCQGSLFQGCVVKVSNTDDVTPALHAIYEDTRIARARNNIYAYRILQVGGVEH